MESSKQVRPIGFSTGSIAFGDFGRALEVMRTPVVTAVELSALRFHELEPLANAIVKGMLDLSQFSHVSVHAPGKFTAAEEHVVIQTLGSLADRGLPIVLHPDAVHEWRYWRLFGKQILVENMDRRKRVGRTAAELEQVFESVPEARLCLDLGHARQFDRTMSEAYAILKLFENRLAQLHISDVSTSSKHSRLSQWAIEDYRQVGHLIPDHVPAILETPVTDATIRDEVAAALCIFAPLHRTQSTRR